MFLDMDINTNMYGCNRNYNRYYILHNNLVECYNVVYNKDFTEITEDQFKQYFSKIKKEETMKQIGWKLTKPEYKKMALDICHTSANWENTLKNYDIYVNQITYINIII